MSQLTTRQAEILRFIRDSVNRSGTAPTRTDICTAFGFSSPNAAEAHLRALATKGYIELVPNSARNIRLMEEPGTPLTQQFELPLIGSIAAGTPITAEENIETRLAIDPGLFRPRADFLHRVSGESMIEADIQDGDLVAIHAQADALNGQIVAAVITDRSTGEEQITLKRYLRRGSRVTLKPENSSPRYRPIEIDLAGGVAGGLGGDSSDSQDLPIFRIAGIFAGLIRAPR
jgi:repressor LexA